MYRVSVQLKYVIVYLDMINSVEMCTSECLDITPTWIHEYVLYSWNGMECVYMSRTWAVWLLRRFPFAVSIFHSGCKGRTRPRSRPAPAPPAISPLTDYPGALYPINKVYFDPWSVIPATPGAKQGCLLHLFRGSFSCWFCFSFFTHLFLFMLYQLNINHVHFWGEVRGWQLTMGRKRGRTPSTSIISSQVNHWSSTAEVSQATFPFWMLLFH